MSLPAIVTELKSLFQPRSVAVVGATNNRGKWGHSTFFSLKKTYTGDLYAVNRHDDMVLGYPAYKKVTDIPGPVDLVVIVVPPENVAQVMTDCVAKEVKAGVIITAGFAEVGEKGKILQDEVLKIAGSGNIRLVGPNCMGIWSAPNSLSAFMFPMPIMPGPLALVSQGGNIGSALVTDAVNRGVGFQQYISCGCTADIQIEDYIEYLGYNDAVKVIMVYIEGLAEYNRFMEKVKTVTRKKPVVIMKPGKTDAAARAISSHSGAMAGSTLIYDAAFKKAGAIRAHNSTELLDISIGLLTQPLPRGKNVVITTPGGSYGVMCAEACALRGLKVIDLPSSAMETFNHMFPDRWSHGNPVDPAGDRDFIQYFQAPEIILKCDEVDALIFMGFGSFQGWSSTYENEIDDEMLSIIKERLKTAKNMLDIACDILDSNDLERIRTFFKACLGLIFGLMSPHPVNRDEFVDTVVAALTTEAMLNTTLYSGLKDILSSLSRGDIDKSTIGDMLGLIEHMVGAMMTYWKETFNKPVITTTFSETPSSLTEQGHYAYTNAERASTVLAKLVAYNDYLERERASGKAAG